jgi:hypothetical protein
VRGYVACANREQVETKEMWGAKMMKGLRGLFVGKPCVVGFAENYFMLAIMI